MVAFVMLERLLGILDPRYVPVCEGGILGTYDPTRDRSRMSKREAFQQDETLLNEFLTEVGIVARFFTNYPVCDEFIRGIRELDRTREIPMYLAFAAQIFLDIHYILRDKVYSGYETCMSQMRLMDEDLALQLDFHANVPTKKWVAPVDEAIKDIRKKIKVHSAAYHWRILTSQTLVLRANALCCSGSRTISYTKPHSWLPAKWAHHAPRPGTDS